MRVLRLARIVSASATIALLASCNGSDSGSGAPGIYTGTPSPLVGIYTGNQVADLLPPDVADAFAGAVAPNGTGYFAASSGVLVMPGLVASTSTATSGTYLPPDPALPLGMGSPVLNVFARGATGPVTIPLSVSYSSATGLLSGTLDNNSLFLHLRGPAPGFSLSVPKSTASFHGFYAGGATSVTLTLDASGQLSGSDGVGCHIVGVLVPIAGTNEYQVSANIEGGALCAGGVYGVAFALQDFDDTGVFSSAAGTYLYIVTATPDNTKAFAVEALMQ